MRKGAFVFLLITFIVVVGGVVIAEEVGGGEKISGDVSEALEKSEEVTVVIKVDEVGGFFGLGKEGSEIVEDVLDGEILGEYGDLIVANVSEEELEVLSEEDSVERIEVSPMFRASLTDSVGVVGASETWGMQVGGVNITGIDETVCVLDTGIDFSHSDLKGKNLTCVIDCFNKACAQNCSFGDDSGHGTHVGGIIGASSGVVGLAGGVNLIALKVLDSSGGSSATGTTDIKNAIDWCVQNREAYNISVISMSLGTENLYGSYCDSSFSSTLTEAINNATAYNISVVSSTGNSGSGVPRNTTHITSPGCIENTTAVSATDKDDSISSYGHYSNITDFFAPGTSITSTYNNGGTEVLSGTSMSAPHVSGAFALVREFFRLQSGRDYTPYEIIDVLREGGKNISVGDYNISRILINASIISLDSVVPGVSLGNPGDGTINFSGSQKFNCNVTDISLKNISFSLWNSSSGIVNLTSGDLSGGFGEFGVNVSNMSFGSYDWNCLAYDSNGNLGMAGSNFSLTIGGIAVSLLTPASGNFTNLNSTGFDCRSRSEDLYSLANVTFELWNSSSGLIYNESKVLSEFDNTTSFEYNFSEEGVYSWNCLGENNNSDSDLGDVNFTVTYDMTSPIVSLLSPDDGASATDGESVSFEFNASDNFALSKCDLIFDGASVGLNGSAIVNGGANSITYGVSSGEYEWGVNCTDGAGNLVGNGTRSLSVEAVSSGDSSGSSGSSGSGSSSGSSSDDGTFTKSVNIFNSELEDVEAEDEVVDESEEVSGSLVTGAAITEDLETEGFDYWLFAFILALLGFAGIVVKFIFSINKHNKVEQSGEENADGVQEDI